jgi:rubrerythrin
MDLARLIALLKKNEEALASLYREGARLFPTEAEVFHKLAQEEEGHATLFTNIQDDLAGHPERWRPGPGRVTADTLEQLQARIDHLLDEVRQGKVAPRYLLTSLASLEQSLAERSADRLLATDEPRLADALRHIAQGFVDHFKRLQQLEARLFPPTQPSLF